MVRYACPFKHYCLPQDMCDVENLAAEFKTETDAIEVEASKFMCGTFISSEGYVCCSSREKLPEEFEPTVDKWYYGDLDTDIEEDLELTQVVPWPGFATKPLDEVAGTEGTPSIVPEETIKLQIEADQEKLLLQQELQANPDSLYLCPEESYCLPSYMCPRLAITYSRYAIDGPTYFCGLLLDTVDQVCCSRPFVMNSLFHSIERKERTKDTFVVAKEGLSFLRIFQQNRHNKQLYKLRLARKGKRRHGRRRHSKPGHGKRRINKLVNQEPTQTDPALEDPDVALDANVATLEGAAAASALDDDATTAALDVDDDEDDEDGDVAVLNDPASDPASTEGSTDGDVTEAKSRKRRDAGTEESEESGETVLAASNISNYTKPVEGRSGYVKPKKCGEVSVHYPSISTLTEAKPGQFPWHVAILTTRYEYLCGGVIIGDKWVLTVAHCVDSFKEHHLYVRVGDHDLLKKYEKEPAYDVNVKRITLHRHYLRAKASLKADIAVLELKNKVLHLPNVHRVCLPGELSYAQEQSCEVASWGAVVAKKGYKKERSDFHSALRHAPFTPMSREKCQSNLRTRTSLGKFFKIHEGVLCAVNGGYSPVCLGDGGSGLVCKSTTGQYILRGLVSWGVGCRRHLPTAFVDIKFYVPFITSVLGAKSFGTYRPHKQRNQKHSSHTNSLPAYLQPPKRRRQQSHEYKEPARGSKPGTKGYGFHNEPIHGYDDGEHGYGAPTKGYKKQGFGYEFEYGYEPEHGYRVPGYDYETQYSYEEPDYRYEESGYGHGESSFGYKEPSKGHKKTGFKKPAKGYKDKAIGYDHGYDESAYNDYGEPSGYKDTHAGYKEPAGYKDTHAGYKEPAGYKDTHAGYKDTHTGYKDAHTGYKEPAGYKDAHTGYEEPAGYKDAYTGYEDKDTHDGYKEPAGYKDTHAGYKEPAGYKDTHAGYKEPAGYKDTHAGYKEPAGYKETHAGYKEPAGYKETHAGYKEPAGYKETHAGYKEPAGYKETHHKDPHTGYKETNSGYKEPTGYEDTHAGYKDSYESPTKGHGTGYSDLEYDSPYDRYDPVYDERKKSYKDPHSNYEVHDQYSDPAYDGYKAPHSTHKKQSRFKETGYDYTDHKGDGYGKDYDYGYDPTSVVDYIKERLGT